MAVEFKPITESFEGETKLRHKFMTDFLFFAETNLKIATKQGTVEPLKLNRAQMHIHNTAERQLREHKKVRLLVLKARQQGCSTYTSARYYWKVTHRRGVNAYVLSHAIDTTKKLFGMTRRYYDHMPDLFKQETRAASSTEFSFGDMDSSYYVGTAGSKETGRGGTVHYMHGSEVAFWANAEMHMGGLMQSIPTGLYSPNTEIILESTANGVGGVFHGMWDEATRGLGEYIPVFTPWYWQWEYRQTPPQGWDLEHPDNEEFKEASIKFDLDIEQAYWMCVKRSELRAEWLFKQEFPATPEEAFQTSGDEGFIHPSLVLEARHNEDIEAVGARVGACDPARFGKDRTCIGYRQGRVFGAVEYYEGKDTMEVARICKDYLVKHGLDRLFIDTNGLGAGVYDRLVEDGYQRVVRPCNFGAGAIQDDRYSNKRAECWGEMKEWFEDKPVQIPNMDVLHTDITSPGYSYDNKTRLKLESKDEMKKRGLNSPDAGDVLAMTFSEPVTPLLQTDFGSVRIITDYDILSY